MTTTRTPSKNGSAIWIAGLVVVIVAGVIAVVVARGSDSDEVADQTAEVTVGAPATDPGGDDPTTTEDGPSPTDAAGTAFEPLPPFEAPVGDPAVGMTLPTVSGTTLDGDPITIGPDGTAKVIVFLAHWCPSCQREVPVIVDYLAATTLPDDVEFTSVSTFVDRSRGNYPPKAWLDGEDWPLPTLADSDESTAAAVYGMHSTPYVVVVDAEGTVVFRITGALDHDQLDALVEAARTGQPPI